MPKSESSLEIILKESSELAEKVKNCWIDPNNLKLNNLLGKGNFGHETQNLI